MPGCSSCGKSTIIPPVTSPDGHTSSEPTQRDGIDPYAPKSSTSALIRLRYDGGGYSKSGSAGCRSCGGGSEYHYVTSEVIRFVSKDAPNGYFKLRVEAGHDYFVTEEQAKYMLALKHKSKAGIEIPKFRKIE